MSSTRVTNVNLGAFCCETGRIGPQGPTGAQGRTGMDGPIGPAGPPGVKGPTGFRGPTGAQGLSASGIQGSQGAVGNIGPQGPQGVNGTPGAQGNQGAQGAQGAIGLGAGPQGPPGPVGAPGPTGSGPTGPAGPAGPTGSQGAPGSGVVAFGMIHKSDGSLGRFRAGGSGIPLLIQSSSGFITPCDNATAWLSLGAFSNISTATDINGLPTQFVIAIAGIYLFTYDISFSFNSGNGVQDQIYRFIAQRAGPTFIPGSESSVTITTNGTRVHVSHSFTYTANVGDSIGIYAEAVQSTDTICTSFHDGSFTCHLISPTL